MPALRPLTRIFLVFAFLMTGLEANANIKSLCSTLLDPGTWFSKRVHLGTGEALTEAVLENFEKISLKVKSPVSGIPIEFLFGSELARIEGENLLIIQPTRTGKLTERIVVNPTRKTPFADEHGTMKIPLNLIVKVDGIARHSEQRDRFEAFDASQTFETFTAEDLNKIKGNNVVAIRMSRDHLKTHRYMFGTVRKILDRTGKVKTILVSEDGEMHLEWKDWLVPSATMKVAKKESRGSLLKTMDLFDATAQFEVNTASTGDGSRFGFATWSMLFESGDLTSVEFHRLRQKVLPENHRVNILFKRIGPVQGPFSLWVDLDNVLESPVGLYVPELGLLAAYKDILGIAGNHHFSH